MIVVLVEIFKGWTSIWWIMFSKDTKGLVSTGDKFKTNLSIVKTVIKSNENRKRIHTEKIKKI